jgi:hypothetical protein
MFGQDRPDPGDLSGPKLTALEIDGLRDAPTVLFDPAIHLSRVKASEEKRQN